MRNFLKKLVCIAAAVSLSICAVSMETTVANAVDGRENVTVIEEGPPIVLDPDASLTAPYSPGEMMDMGISDADVLTPSLLASYPAYTSSQISKRADGK